MKFRLIIDPNRDEEVIIYAKQRSEITDEIENLVKEEVTELIGYGKRDIVKLDIRNVVCFTVDDGKVYAVTDKEKLWIKSRLYQVEGLLDSNFVKINQSCIANIKKIKKFDVSFGGALTVIFKNGYTDYVSRRQMKIVKERIGFNL
ncbi:MAG: LytTR family transcriptional regulator [Ruminococcaceae bacterium]|nr:LytTR family transcriptional regulator [Oscillospiraceae bacterium]